MCKKIHERLLNKAIVYSKTRVLVKGINGRVLTTDKGTHIASYCKGGTVDVQPIIIVIQRCISNVTHCMQVLCGCRCVCVCVNRLALLVCEGSEGQGS